MVCSTFSAATRGHTHGVAYACVIVIVVVAIVSKGAVVHTSSVVSMVWVRPSICCRHHVLGVVVVVWVRPHTRRGRVIHGGGSTTTLRRGGWVRRVRVNGLGTWRD